MQIVQHRRVHQRVAQFPQTLNENNHAINQEQHATKNQIEISSRTAASTYQKIMLRITNSTAITPAHTIGF